MMNESRRESKSFRGVITTRVTRRSLSSRCNGQIDGSMGLYG